MKTYQLDAPPPSAGIYAVRHKPTQRLYIGRSLNLKRRHSEWRGVVANGLNVPSEHFRTMLAGCPPEEWEFLILAEFPGVTEKVLAEKEHEAISKVRASKPKLLLNTLEVSKVRVPGTATSPKSVVTHEGNPIPQTRAAEMLGVSVKMLQKRLARWRGRGVYEISMDQLKALSEKYRV